MEVYNNSLCTKAVFPPEALKAGVIIPQLFRSQERLYSHFVCLFCLIADQCHCQNKLESIQSVPGVNNQAREIQRRVKGKMKRESKEEFVKGKVAVIWEIKKDEERWIVTEKKRGKERQAKVRVQPLSAADSRGIERGCLALSSPHHNDDSLCSEPQNCYKSRRLQSELDKWEPALTKP